MLVTKKNAFTMIELVFVIVILGILASVAIPKFAATRTDAQISKGRSDISSIRSAIMTERQGRLIKGDSDFINRLDNGVATDTEGVKLFDSNETLSATSPKILSYPVTTKDSDGHWMKTGDTNYTAEVENTKVKFNYYNDNGHFDCKGLNSNKADELCKQLTH